jgi:antitoxin StbD
MGLLIVRFSVMRGNYMSNVIFAELIASISELKNHPMQVINQVQGKPIAILNRNQPVCYCV